MEKEYKVVRLADGTKWFIVSEITYNGALYKYGIAVNDAEDDFQDQYQVMRVYESDNKKFIDIVKDQALLREIVPLLVPDAKEYIENPEKLEELIKEN